MNLKTKPTLHHCLLCHRTFSTFSANGFSLAFVLHQNEHEVNAFSWDDEGW